MTSNITTSTKISNIFNNIKSVDIQKEHAKSILKQFSENFEFVLIAGGAPRNWSFNRIANDLDIYVCRKIDRNFKSQVENDKLIADGIKNISNIFGTLGENKVKTDQNSNFYGGFILSHLYDFSVPIPEEKGNKQNCQLIIIDDTNKSVHDLKSFSEKIFITYDFGICMTSMDKDGNFYNSPLFDTDKKNKTFTVNIKELKRNNSAGMSKLVSRFEKMERYFPDHKMRISYSEEEED